MERWQTKAVCGVVMLVAMLICFLLPIKLSVFFRRHGDNGQYYLDLLACFAGGVFLAAYLIFMAPGVRELLLENLMIPHGIEYPLPDMLIGVGFFILLLMNRVVITMSKASKKKKLRHMTDNSINGVTALSVVHSDNASEPSRNSTTTHLVDMDLASGVINGNAPTNQSRSNDATVIDVDVDGEEDLVFQPHSHSPYPLPRRSSIADVAHQDTTVRSILMMLALSLDSILEGVTTGLKATNVEVWAIFIGNLVHETVIAFCLGLQLVRVYDSVKPVVIAAVAYSLMNPVGLAIATIVFETIEASPTVDLFNGIFQALTSGCFIYVTFCEILEGQITHRTSYTKILCMFAGFALLAVFAMVPGSSSYNIEVSLGSCKNGTSDGLSTVMH